KGQPAQAEDADTAITPELDRCTLVVEGRAVKPVRAGPMNLMECVVRGFRLRVEGASVSAFRAGEEKPRWGARAPGAAQLAWLAADEKFVYLAGYTTDGNSEQPRPESPLRVRRLVLASGKWLDDLPVAGKPGPRELEGIRGAVTGAGQVVIITETTDDD